MPSTLSTTPGKKRPPRYIPPARDYSAVDMSKVDKLAVRWVTQGTRMQLNRDEQTLAVRLMCGKVPNARIAARIGANPREVQRILKAHDTIICPLCGQLGWHHQNGVLAEHVAADGIASCAMSGQRYDDREALRLRCGWQQYIKPNPTQRRKKVSA